MFFNLKTVERRTDEMECKERRRKKNNWPSDRNKLKNIVKECTRNSNGDVGIAEQKIENKISMWYGLSRKCN